MKFCQSKGIHIAHLNTRSLRKNIDQIRPLISESGVSIFGCSETWLHQGIDDSIVDIDKYDLIRCDRANRRGGGVCLYVKTGINYRWNKELTANEEELEYVTINVILPHTRPIFVVNIYRPPDSDIEDTFKRLHDIMSKIHDAHHTPEVYIIGDININSNLNRNTGTCKLRYFCRVYNLINIVNGPTHDSGSSIDVCLVNRPEIVMQNIIFHIGITDHSMVAIRRKKQAADNHKRNIKARSFRRFKDAEFIAALRAVDWSTIMAEPDVCRAWDFFTIAFNNLANTQAPYKNMSVRVVNEKWVNEDYISTAHDRDYYSSKYRKTKLYIYKVQHRIFRNKANILARCLKRDYIQDQIEANQGKPDKLWKALREIIPSKNRSTDIMNDDPKLTNLDIANLFNTAFCNMGPSLASNIPSPSNNYARPPVKAGPVPFTIPLLTTQDIQKSINALPKHKATGLDGINARLLKCANVAIPEVLTELFNKSIRCSAVPDSWKCAVISPIYKEGDKTSPSNYRPVSVLSIPMKIVERHVHDALYNFMVSHDLLCREQSGFRRHHSTVTATLDVLDDIYWAMDGGSGSGLVFLDLWKAFDMVDHGILLR